MGFLLGKLRQLGRRSGNRANKFRSGQSTPQKCKARKKRANDFEQLKNETMSQSEEEKEISIINWKKL